MAAAFFEDIWNSIFTPGPSPTLLVATNISFAALQLILLALLIATYSVHFVILSMLSASLWWAINWFVSELKASQAAEEAKKQKDLVDIGPSSESDTEAETVIEAAAGSGSKVVEVVEPRGNVKLRPSGQGDSKSEMSTEDEWEKVSENEKDK